MTIRYTSQFKKDYKRLKKQNKDLSKFQTLIKKIVNQEPLDKKYKDHSLTGSLKGCRDCHIEPDWLVIYKIADNTLILIRIGSHSDLFK